MGGFKKTMRNEKKKKKKKKSLGHPRGDKKR
jgi:hypothetical protein